ncbi:hypothetical protein KBX10_04615 [Corynebacterium sp. CCUG 59401]|nr:hypothetical protein [Corynebacterium pseudogenitalium]
MVDPQSGIKQLVYRIGEIQAFRKDLRNSPAELEENQSVSCSAELGYSVSEEELDQEITLQVESWNAFFKVTLKAILRFDGTPPSSEEIGELRRNTLIPGVCNAAFIEVSRLCREIDVNPIGFPVEMIDGLVQEDLKQSPS